MLASSVFAATLRILRRPAFFVPAFLVALASDAGIHFNGWPTADLNVWPVERQFSVAVIVLLARGWFDLTLIGVGLAVLREQPAGVLKQWVHVWRAIQIGAVSVLLLAGVLLGTLFVIVPGVYLLLRWSQALPAMVEGRTRLSDVFGYSEALASEHYLRILLIWLLAWGTPALLAWGVVSIHHALQARGLPDVQHLELASRLGWSAVLHTLGLALVAGLYVELDARWNARKRYVI